MGFMDHHNSSTPLTSPKPWSFLCSAKTTSFSADLNFASPRPQRLRHRFFSVLSGKERSGHSTSCRVSLRIRIHQFLLKVKIAAGRLKELRVSSFSRFRKVTLVDVKASENNSKGNQLVFFSPLASGSPQRWASPTSSWTPSLSFSPLTKSTLIYGAGLGTFVFLLSRCASLLHMPLVLVQTGLSIARLIAGNLRSGKRQTAAGSRASPIIQGLRKAAAVCRMAFIMFRRTLMLKRLVVSALLIVTIGLIWMRKSRKLQDLLARRKHTRKEPSRVLVSLLLATKLIKRWWSHIDAKSGIALVVLVAILANLLKQQ